MTKASDLFVACLEFEGAEHVFGVPGEENLDLLDSLSRSKQIRLILNRHGQAAGFMAARAQACPNSDGMIRWKPAAMGFEDWGLACGNPDFVKYAEG